MSTIRQSQLAQFFSRLGTSYSAGIDLRSILNRESQSGSTVYRQVNRQLASSLDQGISLAESMRKTGCFPELAISVVHAGERGGRLDQSFSRLSEHYTNLVTFRNRLLAALAWPAFELTVAILLVGGLIAICDWIYESMEIEKFNWLGMGSTTGNVIAWFVLVFAGMAVIGVLVVGTRKGWFGDFPMKIARRIPLIGKTIESLALSRFAWTLSVAENAGMNPIEVSELSLGATENYFYRQHQSLVAECLQGGNTYYKTFRATGAFPEDLLIAIDNGEVAGELAESMDRMSREYQERADMNLKLIGTVGFVLMLLFVGAVVLMVAITAVGAYTNMLNDLSQP